jgi:hypothetical protein
MNETLRDETETGRQRQRQKRDTGRDRKETTERRKEIERDKTRQKKTERDREAETETFTYNFSSLGKLSKVTSIFHKEFSWRHRIWIHPSLNTRRRLLDEMRCQLKRVC